MSSGFQRVEANLADYELDCPAARQIFADLRERGFRESWLDQAAPSQ
jgi:hypothetical protein